MNPSPDMQVLLVDDEPVARRGLRRLLAREPGVEIVGECSNGAAAVEALRDLDVDLLFLDVQMPGLDGFDVVHAVGLEHMPPIVFVTAFDQYAVQAFEANAIDYLLKPVEPERFAEAVRRARESVEARRAPVRRDRLEQLLERIEAREQYPRRLAVREAGRLQFVPTAEIDWIEAAGNYVRLHAGGRVLLLREGLASLEGRLDPREFVRIHRSSVVRVDRVREVRPIARGDSDVQLADGTHLTASRRYRRDMDERLRGPG